MFKLFLFPLLLSNSTWRFVHNIWRFVHNKYEVMHNLKLLILMIKLFLSKLMLVSTAWVSTHASFDSMSFDSCPTPPWVGVCFCPVVGTCGPGFLNRIPTLFHCCSGSVFAWSGSHYTTQTGAQAPWRESWQFHWVWTVWLQAGRWPWQCANAVFLGGGAQRNR
jgi:hypothetical protein